jgi:hypothetical protein
MAEESKLAIRCSIRKDGKIIGTPTADPTSGDTELDNADYAGLMACDPFPPMPSEFPGNYLELRFPFYYNPGRSDHNPAPPNQSPTPSPAKQ